MKEINLHRFFSHFLDFMSERNIEWGLHKHNIEGSFNSWHPLSPLLWLGTMKELPLVFLLLLFGGQRSSACPHLCSCHGGQVNCSSRSLTVSALPSSFPAGTTNLQLHNNLLTTLPNGLLDDLTSLRSVSLHGNPWACDCGILYLRSWLLRQPASITSHVGVNCSSPPNLRGRLVAYLTEAEVAESCHYWYCNLALASQVCLFVFVVVQAGLLVALIFFLRRFEKLSREAKRITEESFTPADGHRENEYMPLKDGIWHICPCSADKRRLPELLSIT